MAQTNTQPNIVQVDRGALVAKVKAMLEAGARALHEKPVIRTRGGSTYRIGRLPLTSWMYQDDKGYFVPKAITQVTRCTPDVIVDAIRQIQNGTEYSIDYIGCDAETLNTVIREAMAKRWESSNVALAKGYSIYIRDRREPKPNLKGAKGSHEAIPDWMVGFADATEEEPDNDAVDQQQADA